MDFAKDGYNSLFLQWLKEWKEEAANTKSNIQYTYVNASKSLKSYPLPLFSGHSCITLNYFGDHTCKKLEKKLVTYLKENKLKRIEVPDPFLAATGSGSVLPVRKPRKKASKSPKASKSKQDDGGGASVGAAGAPVPVVKKKRAPVSKKRKSTDEIALLPSSSDDVLSDLPVFPDAKISKVPKSQTASSVTILESTPVVTASVRSASSSSAYSAFASASGSQSRAVLTIGGGGGFTTRLCSSSDVSASQGVGSSQSVSDRFASIPLEEFTLHPGSFDIVLCVDNQEIHGTRNTRSKADVIAELTKQKTNFNVRSLKAGDFLWIAQEKLQTAAGRKPRELVLDFIAERKRGDDLAISIKDGRYTCQKFRMKMSSLRRIIYIIEDTSRFSNKGLTDQALFQAMANMELQDDFLVRVTENLRQTVEFLIMVTRYLQNMYLGKRLKSCSYASRCEDKIEFNPSLPMQNLLSFGVFSTVAKTNQAKSVSQAFLLQLLALDGVSPAKASAIVTKYPTVRRLMAAFDSCETEKQKETLLRDLKFGSGLKCIGPTISKKLFQLYCATGPLK